MLCFRANCKGRQGITLLELLLAVSIGSVVTLFAMSLLVFGARMSRIPAVHGVLDVQARTPVEQIKNAIRMSMKFTIQDEGGSEEIEGDRLVVTAPNGIVSTYFYEDADSEPKTFFNNRLMCDSGIAGTQPEAVLSYLDRSSGVPLFHSPNTGGSRNLTIRLRLSSQARSGASEYQAVDVVTTVGARNIQ